MKRFTMTAVMLLVLTAVALPMFAATADSTLEVQVRIPQNVGIKINDGVTPIVFDLTASYPPSAFPGYYAPTSGGPINMDIFCNVSAGYTLTVEADGNFLDGEVLIEQLYYTTNLAEAVTTNGDAAPGGTWTSYTVAPQTIIDSNVKTTGWDEYDQIVQFQVFEDDPSIDENVILTYTITSKP
ncbi:MAG: hypothetical protein AB7T10_03905 [bacterium]